jgi:hypothetical protein
LHGGALSGYLRVLSVEVSHTLGHATRAAYMAVTSASA